MEVVVVVQDPINNITELSAPRWPPLNPSQRANHNPQTRADGDDFPMLDTTKDNLSS